MKVSVYSRQAIETLINTPAEFPRNAAVISFSSPPREHRSANPPVDYSNVCHRVFHVWIPDIDIEILPDYGYTFDSYLSEADRIAEFIYQARKDNCVLICQCDYGQSRSAACAAAILEHFERRGIEIFADYRYYPNQLVYNKIKDALDRFSIAAKGQQKTPEQSAEGS